MDTSPANVTLILARVRDGDPTAAGQLMSMVYDELRAMARSRMRHVPPGQTLQSTALVHEAFIRLVGDGDSSWENRKHFFFAAGRAMRDILVDQAVRKSRKKRGGDRKRVAFDEKEIAVETAGDDVLAMREALNKLELESPDDARIVHLLHFAGLSIGQTAELLGVSKSTIDRKWRFLRTWLRREMGVAAEADDAHG